MGKKLKFKDVLILLAIFALLVVMLYSVVRILEGLLDKDDAAEPMVSSRTIVRDGVEYYPRQDIVTILLAGIDETGPVKDSGTYNNPGEADMVALVVLDQKQESIEVLALNRDTMVEMPVLGIGGKPAGTTRGQLALSHTYGSGLTDSAQNLKQTVSDLLYDVKIDYYVTLNMDAIAILNDGVGGVTVNVEEDFSQVDDTIGMGQVTLKGEQALTYLRSRQGVGDQLNLTRMERQEEYMSGFTYALKEKLAADSNFAATLFEEVGPYMVTDLTLNALLGLVKYHGDYGMGDIHTPAGENVTHEFMEYHLDEAALDKLILGLLYERKS